MLRLSEQLLELVSVYTEASKNLKFIFLLNKAQTKKLKTICACIESIDLIV
jgi:hypothetical protein